MCVGGAPGGQPIGQYKYAIELSKVPDCPPHPQYTALERKAYRWAKATANGAIDPYSFLPRAKQPPRVNRPNYKLQCGDLALSSFETAAKLKAKFDKLCATASIDWRAAQGDRLVEGVFYPADGVQDEPSADGHFNLHEFANRNVIAQFQIVGTL
jgi:hypothetical protein